MKSISTIAIDGPASSGKSTLGKELAARLGFLFFDTGVMYRAVACAALARNLNINDESEITNLAENLRLDLQPASVQDGRDNDLLVDGEDITWAIRDPAVDASVSTISAYPGVREALTIQQRRLGERGRIVMVGRDIGTVVMPNADLKIYLDASAEERARRRYEERRARNEKVDMAEILSSIRQRDQKDSSRKIAPLVPAEDAVIIQSDDFTIDEVVEKALTLVSNQYNT